MSKPIYITDDILEKMVSEFREKLSKTRAIEGEISFKTELKEKKTEKAKLHFTSEAYLKMMYLVDSFEGEVGWYGLVKRLGDREFQVYDIILYPQDVTGATVTTDEVKMGDWENSLDDETFFAKRFQGHSHVNFSPTPSGTDLDDRRQKIKQLAEEDYFIFLIINKKREYTAAIYDIVNNVQYETNDIELTVESEAMDFLDSLSLVQSKPAFSYAYSSTQQTKTKKKTETKPSEYDYEAWYKRGGYMADDLYD